MTAPAVTAAPGEPRTGRPLRIALVSSFGSRDGGYFSDVLLGLLCRDARDLGHDARMLRVYYDGADRARDGEVSARVTAWLDEQRIDLVVADRVLDPASFAQWKTRCPDRRLLLLPPPEGMASVEPGDAAIAYRPYERRRPGGEMGDEVRRAFALWLASGLAPPDAVDIPGLSAVRDGLPEPAARSLVEAADGPRLDYRPVLDFAVIAAGDPASVRPAPYAVFGNGGCPYSRDVSQAAPYRDLPLPGSGEVLRKGCAFCTMGGDYDKRSDADTVESVLRQAAYLVEHLPAPHAFVLTDQHPLRYLPLLLEEAERRGIRAVTWLLETRADWLVEHRAALQRSLEIAARSGTRLELYLVGFESFSDDDLELFNKGVTHATLLAAAALVRELVRAHPACFGYTRERGHSLILFHPWTTPARLRVSGEVLRAHGLADFFHDITRNRLRLYPRLPIFALAASQGLAVDAWEAEAVAGTARAKGYSVDIAWRFADPRAAVAYELCRHLRRAFGNETEISQLLAVARWLEAIDAAAAPGPEEATRRLAAATDRLAARVETLLQGSRGARAAAVLFAGACNNGCSGCENRDRFLPDDADALAERVDEARGRGLPVMLAGREPTLHPELVALVRRARGADGRRVGVVSNGRRFAYPRFARAVVAAGLSDASVKIFAARADAADAITRVGGAFAQAMQGVDHLVRGAGVRVELRALLYAAALDTPPELATLACAHGVGGIRSRWRSTGSVSAPSPPPPRRWTRSPPPVAPPMSTSPPAPLPSGMRGFDRLPS
ncbi:MAG: radical SAM protein [Candidatus Binatia bacterium]